MQIGWQLYWHEVSLVQLTAFSCPCGSMNNICSVDLGPHPERKPPLTVKTSCPSQAEYIFIFLVLIPYITIACMGTWEHCLQINTFPLKLSLPSQWFRASHSLLFTLQIVRVCFKNRRSETFFFYPLTVYTSSK